MNITTQHLTGELVKSISFRVEVVVIVRNHLGEEQKKGAKYLIHNVQPREGQETAYPFNRIPENGHVGAVGVKVLVKAKLEVSKDKVMLHHFPNHLILHRMVPVPNEPVTSTILWQLSHTPH